jgi:hypothetical protein
LCFSLELIHVWRKFELFNVWDIILINGGFSNHFRCDGLIIGFLCYFVWCVNNDRCNCQYYNAQKFDFLVICCYLVVSISIPFKSYEPNSKNLLFWQIKIPKNLSRGPNINVFLHFDKNSHQKNIHHHLNNIMKLKKKNIKKFILIIYDIFHIRWMMFNDGLFDEVEL